MIRTLLLYAVLAVTVVLALAACGSPSPSPVTTPAVTPTSAPASTPTTTPTPAPRPAPIPTTAPSTADLRPRPHRLRRAPQSPHLLLPRLARLRLSQLQHSTPFPNSNCHTRCDYGSNKYAYPHTYTYTYSYACAHPIRGAARFRGKGQRSNAAVS